MRPSKQVPGENGTFTTRQIEMNIYFIVYGGKVFPIDDPDLPTDNTYQMLIPGTNTVIDASHGAAIGTGDTVNECWDPELANCRPAPYSELSYIHNIKINNKNNTLNYY